MRAKAKTSGCASVLVDVCVSKSEKKQTAALGVNVMLLVLHT